MARKLYRSKDDRVLGGVAAGLGQYFNIDPTIVRLAFVVLTLWGGTGIVLYLITWVVVPEAPGGYEAAASETFEHDSPRRVQSPDDRRTLGWIIIAVGAGLVVVNVPVLSMIFSPAVIIGGGLIIWGLITIGKNDRPPRVR